VPPSFSLTLLNPRLEVDDLCPAPAALMSANPPEVDLVVTLGGDGTILHVSSLYARAGRVPPVVSFSMGSLGFLLPFRKSRLFFLVPARVRVRVRRKAGAVGNDRSVEWSGLGRG
jgi:NAD kinase